jgi:uncharacterized protein
MDEKPQGTSASTSTSTSTSKSTSPPEPSVPEGGDPSMEDILASIRRILSEDEPPPISPPPETGDVLVLDTSMMVPEETQVEHTTEPATPRPADAASERTAPAPDVAAPQTPGAGAGSGTPPAAPQTLVAPEAAAAAASSMGTLMRTLTERSATISRGGPALEDIVRDELRPLLKQWLDAHLPVLVERLVRAEIERVMNRSLP